jgi:hypothetical protein
MDKLIHLDDVHVFKFERFHRSRQIGFRAANTSGLRQQSLLMYGFGLEFAQGIWFEGRTTSFGDMLADGIGCVCRSPALPMDLRLLELSLAAIVKFPDSAATMPKLS